MSENTDRSSTEPTSKEMTEKNTSSPTTTTTKQSTISSQPHIDAGTCGCACDWGEEGGHLIKDVCTCSPCCGDPCTFKECMYCCCIYFWCNCCFTARIYAYSLDQDCAVINHCLPTYCCHCLLAAIGRANLRQKANVGEPGCQIGDAIVPWCCCSCCAHLQAIRSVPIEAWDMFGEGASDCQCVVEPFVITRPYEKMNE